MSSSARFSVLGAAALAGLVAGCGFKPAAEMPLPAQMKSTYIASATPYGDLENMLRREIARRGDAIADNRGEATAVLQILSADHSRRVLAVNADGRPTEYAINYSVRFRLLDASGATLLAVQTLTFSREYAYLVTIELGAAREQNQILVELQRQATQSILARLEALAHRSESATPVPSGLFKRLN